MRCKSIGRILALVLIIGSLATTNRWAAADDSPATQPARPETVVRMYDLEWLRGMTTPAYDDAPVFGTWSGEPDTQPSSASDEKERVKRVSLFGLDDGVVEDVHRVLRDTVGQPEDWDEYGGTLSSAYIINAKLFVKTTPENHRSVLHVLQQLRGNLQNISIEAFVLRVRATELESMKHKAGMEEGSLVLTSKQAKEFRAMVMAGHPGMTLVGAARTITRSGQSSSITTTRWHTYITEATNTSSDEKGNERTSKEQSLDTVYSGSEFEVHAVADRDAKLIDLTCRFQITSVPDGERVSASEAQPLLSPTSSPPDNSLANPWQTNRPQVLQAQFRHSAQVEYGGGSLVSVGTHTPAATSSGGEEVVIFLQATTAKE